MPPCSYGAYISSVQESSTRRRVTELVILGSGLFALLELSARVYLFGWAGLVPSRINSVHGLPQADIVWRSSEDRLGFEFKPNLDGYFKLTRFQTNSRGLRDREYALRKPEDTFRVVVLGASFALPSGVEIDAAFHSLLEEELSSQPGGLRYEFINFAVGMYSPKQMLAMLELRALDYDPDLVLITATNLSARLFGATATDPSAPPETKQPRPLPVFEKSYPILQSFLYRLIEQRIARPYFGRHVGLVERLFMDLVEWWSPDHDSSAMRGDGARRRADHGNVEKLAEPSVLEELAAIRDRRNIPIVLVRLEINPREPSPIDLALAARCRSLGLYYLDTRAAFRGSRPGEFWIYQLDPHPNWRAHEIFAREIGSFLASEGLLSPMQGR